MGIMTLRCIVQDHRHRNLQHFVRKPSASLGHRQRRDGSFGDLRGTALAMQALEEAENEPHGSWNRSGAIGWLVARQRPDGSFDADVRITAEVVLGLAPRSLSSVRSLDCGQGLTDSPPPRFATANGSYICV
jgi:gastric intrinsic factor